MYVLLGDESVHFLCDNDQTELMLGLIFDSWPRQIEPPVTAKDLPQYRRPIVLELQTTDVLDRPPEPSRLVFSDQSSLTCVLKSDHYWYIRFGADATGRIPKRLDDGPVDPIKVQVTRRSLFAGRLEDVIFSSLAPILRRRGLYMIHAFAATRDGHAMLLVGESGSGKTTTGLSMIEHGWRYLANDVVLIEEDDGAVFALPTPGGIALDADSYELLSNGSNPPAGGGENSTKHYLAAMSVVRGWAERAPVAHVFFPKIETEGEIKFTRLSRSVTLARLLEASVDRWDCLALEDHANLTQALSRQATGYDLRLNRDLQRLPGILNQIL